MINKAVRFQETEACMKCAAHTEEGTYKPGWLFFSRCPYCGETLFQCEACGEKEFETYVVMHSLKHGNNG